MRPTEEETDLQALQSLPDEALRPEFVEAKNKLRTKVLKRVKPKSLNGKFITGEMLLELCQSYTKAINKGSIPSIKNAWSYVCQNECQRAIYESINAFEASMNEFLESAKKEANIDILEEGSSNILEESVRKFKDKAVGGDIEEFELLLRKELKNKYKDFKKLFNSHCEDIMDQMYDNKLSQIRRGVNIGSADGDNVPIKEQILAFKQE